MPWWEQTAVAETAAWVAETADYVAETAGPVAETAGPVAETAGLDAETANSVAETAVKARNSRYAFFAILEELFVDNSSSQKIRLPGLSWR